MAGRYLVSGSWLGLMQGLLEAGKTDEAIKQIKEILDKQFLGNSKQPILADVKKLEGVFDFKYFETARKKPKNSEDKTMDMELQEVFEKRNIEVIQIIVKNKATKYVIDVKRE